MSIPYALGYILYNLYHTKVQDKCTLLEKTKHFDHQYFDYCLR
jgi:hypothetical protein